MSDTTVALVTERLAVSGKVEATLSTLFRLPTAVAWNRLEGRPRADDLTRPLRAELRDPAWMLGRQWQFGEFAAEDAGTPIQAKMVASTSPLRRIRLGQEEASQPYDPATPVEFQVERQAVVPDLLMGLHIGRRWISLLAGAFGAADPLIDSFRTGYPVASPAPDARDLDSLKINANRSERTFRRAVSKTALDGAALLGAIRRSGVAGGTPSDVFVADHVVIEDERRPAVDALAADLQTWFDGLFGGRGATAWIAPRLEYHCTLSAPEADGTESRLIADQFPGGHLDWYSFDIAPGVPDVEPDPLPPADPPKSFVPTPVTFFGAPAVRWWEFEDSRVGFGLTTAAKTDLAKILLAEFGLVFSNDWFILPYRAAIGSLIDVKGIVVTDNFGFNTLVEPVAKRHRELNFAGNWSMWTLGRRDQPGQVDSRLFLAPALEPPLESKPVDEVVFLRDEMANLVWGVETIIPSELGGGRDARLAARELTQAIVTTFAPPPPDVGDDPLADVPIRYQLMGSVPENWIPFVAVKLVGQSVATNLLQGAMPRDPAVEPTLGDDGRPLLENNVTLPRGRILSRDPVTSPNRIHEEEILRDGIVVQRTFRHARWTGAGAFTWSALKKRTGRGEGSSGLAFDQAITKPPPRPADV